MRVAIHQDNSSWSRRWIEYCREHRVDFGVVDCYSSNIIQQLKSFDILLWQFAHYIHAEVEFARHVLYSAEKMGLAIFPGFNTVWHYDDKVAQKYLLEAVDAPLADSWVFYRLDDTICWLEEVAQYPLVAKLRRGSGSHNVTLLRTRRQAKRYAHRMFGRGFQPVQGYCSDIRNKIRTAKDLSAIISRLKRLPRFLREIHHGRRTFPAERGYAYFQEYLPNNSYDTRVTVVGDSAFAFQRAVRKGDFRASGSGMISYDHRKIDMRCVEIAFRISKALATQSLAFDFVMDADRKPKILEVCFTFVSDATRKCKGIWKPDLSFVPGSVHVEDLILNELVTDHGLESRNTH